MTTATSKASNTSHAGNTGGATTSTGRRAQASKVGIVQSDKRSKTRKVVVPNDLTHPKYGKIIRRRTVLHVHDGTAEPRTGDMVEVASCRPLSKTKFCKLVRVVRQGAGLRFEAVAAPETGEPAPAATPAAVKFRRR